MPLQRDGECCLVSVSPDSASTDVEFMDIVVAGVRAALRPERGSPLVCALRVVAGIKYYLSKAFLLALTGLSTVATQCKVA